MPPNRSVPFSNQFGGISALPNEFLLYIFDVLAQDDADVDEARHARIKALENKLPELRTECKNARKQLDRHLQRRRGSPERNGSTSFGEHGSRKRQQELEVELKSLKTRIIDTRGELRRLRFAWKRAFDNRTSYARCLAQVCKKWKKIIESERPHMNTNIIIFLDNGVGIPMIGPSAADEEVETPTKTSSDGRQPKAPNPPLIGSWDGSSIGAALAHSSALPVNICLAYSKRIRETPPPPPPPPKQQKKPRPKRPGKVPPPAAVVPSMNPEVETARLSQFFSILVPHLRRVKRLTIETQYVSSMPSVPDIFDSDDGSDVPTLKRLDLRNPVWRLIWTPKIRRRLDEHGDEVINEDWEGHDPADEGEDDEPEDHMTGEGATQATTTQGSTSFHPSTQAASSTDTSFVLNGRLTSMTDVPPRYGNFIRNPAEARKFWNPPVLRGYNVLEALRDQEWADHFCGPFPVVDSRQHYYQAYDQRKLERERARRRGQGKVAAKEKEKGSWVPPPPPRRAWDIVLKDFRIGQGDELQVSDFLAFLDRKRLGYIRSLTFENVEVSPQGPSSASSSGFLGSQGGTRRAMGAEALQVAVKYLAFLFPPRTGEGPKAVESGAASKSAQSPSPTSFASSFFTLTQNRVTLASLSLSSVPICSLPLIMPASPLQAWSLDLKSLPAGSFPHILDIVRNWNGMELRISDCGDVVDDRLLRILTMKKGAMRWSPFICGVQLRTLSLIGPPLTQHFEREVAMDSDDEDMAMSDFDESGTGLAPVEEPPVAAAGPILSSSSSPLSVAPPPSIPKLGITPHALKELVLAREKDSQRYDPTKEKDLSFTLPLYSITVSGAEQAISADDKKWLSDHVDFFMWSSDQKALDNVKTETDGDIGAAEAIEVTEVKEEKKEVIEIPDSPVVEPKRESETEVLDRSLEELELDSVAARPCTTANVQDVVISDSDSDGSRAPTPVPTSHASSSQPSQPRQGNQSEPITISDSEDDFMPLRPSSLLFLPASSPPPERFSSPAPGFLRVEENDNDVPMNLSPPQPDVQSESAEAAIVAVAPEPSLAVDMTSTEPANVAGTTTRFVATFDSPILENDFCDMSMEEIEALDLDAKPSAALPPSSSSPSRSTVPRSPPRFESPPLEADFSDIFSAEDIPDF